MPPRLSKRQLREQAELEQLAAQQARTSSSPDEQSDDEVEAAGSLEQATAAAAATDIGGAFGALNLAADEPGLDQDDDDGDDEPEQQVATKKKSKPKKKKKKAKAADEPASTADTTPSTGTPSKKTSNKNKSTAKAGDDLDEIDRALAELAAKDGTSLDSTTHSNARLDAKWQAVKDIYSFDPKLLDSDAELRRMFGSKVVSTTHASTPRSPYHARLANNPHHSTSIKRTNSFLAQPEAGWYPPTGVLKLVPYDGPEAQSDQGDWYTYEHPFEYRAAQLSFLEVLQQADGNRLFNVLQAQPYHVDTLMQLSEMMAQQGDLGASGTNLNRALYALSAPLPPTFPSGSFRLPYSRIENRAFFLGVARKVALLTKRGTWRTACEWAKIGLGVGGGLDPVGMLTFIDFLAPKARQNAWFLSMLETLPKAYADQYEMRLEAYPGLAFAKALCLRNIEEDKNDNDEKSTAALRSAILRFPMVVTQVLTALGSNIPPKLVSHRRAQVDGAFSSNPSYIVSLLATLYAARSSPLWKPPPLQSWLERTAASAANSLDDTSLEDVRTGECLYDEGAFPTGVAPAGIIRAAFVADIPSVRPYVPPSVVSGTTYSYDPVPPAKDSGATFYDDAYFAPLYQARKGRRRGQAGGTGGGGGGGGGRMAEAAAAMRDQLANLLGMGPGGPQVELNPELREELLQELHMLGAEARGRGDLPGGFPGDDAGAGFQDEDEEWNDDENEEDEEGAEGEAGPNLEQARNFLDRLAALLGGGAGAGGPPAGAQDARPPP